MTKEKLDLCTQFRIDYPELDEACRLFGWENLTPKELDEHFGNSYSITALTTCLWRLAAKISVKTGGEWDEDDIKLVYRDIVAYDVVTFRVSL